MEQPKVDVAGLLMKEDFQKIVMKRVRQAARTTDSGPLFSNRKKLFAMYATAASITLLLLFTGMFGNLSNFLSKANTEVGNVLSAAEENLSSWVKDRREFSWEELFPQKEEKQKDSRSPQN